MQPQSWAEIGATYQVRKHEYLATIDGATNRCPCADCVQAFKDMQLFLVYEVLHPLEDSGKILFEDCCEIISS